MILADQLRAPENMGSVLRLAGNIGAGKTVFLSDIAGQFRSYKIKKTASGAFDKTDWEISGGNRLADFVPGDYQIIALETSTQAQNLFDFRFPEKCAFLVGSEVHGIRPEILNQADHQVYIPIPGPVSSLNVTHALSIALFEWLRQWFLI